MKIDNIALAREYFDLSNESNFDGIESFFTPSTTYSSQNTGLYLGKEDIMKMQKTFHNSFSKLSWEIDTINEVKPSIISIQFTFSGIKSGEHITFKGLENIVFFDGKIQHIEIKNI